MLAVFGIGLTELVVVAFICGLPVIAGLIGGLVLLRIARERSPPRAICPFCGRPTTPGLPCPHCTGKETAGSPPAP